MRFACVICGGVAGTVSIEDGKLRRESFTGVLLRPAPAWLGSIRGVCPQGHERMLED